VTQVNTSLADPAARPSWWHYWGDGVPAEDQARVELPAPPPWRAFHGGPTQAPPPDHDDETERKLGQVGAEPRRRATAEECDLVNAALMLRHMVGQDECDATSLAFPGEIELPTAERLDGVRIGVALELTSDGIQAGVLEAFQSGLARAQELGAELQDVSLPHAPHALSAYYVLAPAECSSNLARFDGVRYGMRAPDADDLLEMYTRTRHDGFGAEVKRRIMLGTYALSSGYYDAYYGRAQRVRTKIAEDFRTAFASVDFIAAPTSPTVAFRLGEKTADPLSMYLSDYCTVPMSLAGVPAISIPCGLSEGLPVGLQLTGPAFSENRLLDAAHALEHALEFDARGAHV